jgi:hypothetical protein
MKPVARARREQLLGTSRKACMAVSLLRMVSPSARFCKVIKLRERGSEFPQVKKGT